MANTPYRLTNPTKPTSATGYAATPYAKVGARQGYGTARPTVNANARFANPYAQAQNTAVSPEAYGMTPKEYKKLTRTVRKDRSYFFVMRKGVCFLIFLFLLIMVAFIGLSAANIETLEPYTALYLEPDNTPYENRENEYVLDEDGKKVVGDDGNYLMNYYEDTSVYYSVMDPILGFIAELTGEPILDEVTNKSKSPFYDKTLAALDANRQNNAEDTTAEIAYYVFKFAPAILVVGVLAALIGAIVALCATSGKRVYRGFWIVALITLISAVVTLLAGIAAVNMTEYVKSVSETGAALDFGQLMPFLTQYLQGPVESEAALTEYPQLTFVGGYLVLAVLIVPIVVLVLSLFTKRKVSYRIFDK